MSWGRAKRVGGGSAFVWAARTAGSALQRALLARGHPAASALSKRPLVDPVVLPRVCCANARHDDKMSL
jgi:hypothetical protein